MREYLTDTLWTELFVFTKDEFFTLLPLLQLPPNFHVENNGYVPCSPSPCMPDSPVPP